MSALMEHHDLKTARRALVAGSIALFIVSDLQFLSNEIEFFKLRFAVDQEKIALFGTVAVCYLTYIFSLRAYEASPIASDFLPSRTEKLYAEAAERMKSLEVRRRERMDGLRSGLRIRTNDGETTLSEEDQQIEPFVEAIHSLVKKEEAATSQLISNLTEKLERIEYRKRVNFFLAELAPPYVITVSAVAKSLDIVSIFSRN